MKTSHRAIAVLLVLSALIFTLLGRFLNTLVDKNRYRLVQELQKSLGRSLTFEELRLDFWGGPGLSVTQVRVAEDPRFAAAPFIQSKELRMQLRWLPLLWGRVEVRKLILDEPEIQIIRNEAGNLNLFALAVARESPGESREDRPGAAPRLLVSSVRVVNGKIHYVDRYGSEPVGVLVRNVDLDLRGLAPAGAAEIKLGAALFETEGQNVGVEGRIGPFQRESEWTQQPVDLHVRADPLLLLQLTRVIPTLRDKADFYLGITGPVTLQARLRGTVQRPRITDLSFTAAVFDSPKNNAGVTGELDFSQGDTWTDGRIKGKLTIDPVGFEQLRKLPAVKRALSSSLITTGPLGVTADLQGRLSDLRVHARIEAGKSELRYKDWFAKPKGIPAEIDVAGRVQTDRFLIERSTLSLNNAKVRFSGWLENSPDRRLTLKLRSGRLDVSRWDNLLPLLASFKTSGTLRLDLSVEKQFTSGDRNVDIWGNVDLRGIRLRAKEGAQAIDKIGAFVSFHGREARIDEGAMRLGSSDLAFEARMLDLSQPLIRYTVRSPRLKLADLIGTPAYRGDEIRNLLGTGELEIENGKTWLRGTVASPEGVVQELPYRNLRGEIAWSSGNLSFRDLSLQMLSGTVYGAGDWERRAENSQTMALEARVENMDIQSLLRQKLPQFKDNVDGRLDLNAKLRGISKNGAVVQDDLQGEGSAEVNDGTLKDFNLIELVLSKVKGLPGVSDLVSSRLSQRYSDILKRADTPFHTLTSNFTVAEGRVLSRDFHIATPDYSIYGEGWIGFDKNIKWDGTLVMSAQFTGELMKEHKTIRYLLDRHGRLAIPFHLQGTLPRVQAKPDVERLARAIQRGFLRRGERPAAGEKTRAP